MHISKLVLSYPDTNVAIELLFLSVQLIRKHSFTMTKSYNISNLFDGQKQWLIQYLAMREGFVWYHSLNQGVLKQKKNFHKANTSMQSSWAQKKLYVIGETSIKNLKDQQRKIRQMSVCDAAVSSNIKLNGMKLCS